MRSAINKVLKTDNKEEAEKIYAGAVSVIDKSVSKKLIHKNTGARRKAQITRHLNSLS
jgi:ribosomal protein S20|tara:strand:+ start:295 stop:468 length:174 start_codon:yes stop_codon:yes gene_type:complete